ncbi:MAG: ATP phosphoribosyltransferase [Lysobacter sp.]|nr:ATP phosphoribosyltransferase [Lysobacter sp.]MDQ3270369.1 ATP phosphoribosyltransferase [Pseudomonadota bacterium]
MSTSNTCAAPRDRLRIAIQKSGRLAEAARNLLASCGLSWRESRDRLFCYGETLPIDLLLVRDDDIPGLIADGVCDLGVVGRNVLLEYDRSRADAPGGPAFREWRALGFGACRLDIAVPDGWEWDGPQQLAGKRIATSYPALLSQWLEGQGVQAEVVLLSGSVEIAPRLGQAEAICDLVSSGATLTANQLKPVATLLQSEAVLAGPVAGFDHVRGELADLLQRRLDGALRIRHSKLLMFQSSRELLPTLLSLLPDADAPTVMRIDGEDGLALQALCHGALTWQRLEDLKRAGARGLMVLPVEGMLA